MTLDDVVNYIAEIVAARAAKGNNFGTVLIPEGLIEFIPAMKRLIAELNDYLAANGSEFAMIKKSEQINYIIKHLSPENSAIYASLPEGVARQLTLDRDPHGNVQVSLIETEKLLGEMVGRRLAEMLKPKGNSWVNSLRNSTSSVTKAVVPILPISMPTIVILSVIPQHCW